MIEYEDISGKFDFRSQKRRKHLEKITKEASYRNKKRPLPLYLTPQQFKQKLDNTRSELIFLKMLEIWDFPNREEYFKHRNEKFIKFYPDFLNRDYSFVVEIDGSFHKLPEQIKKDHYKDIFYKAHELACLRIDSDCPLSFFTGTSRLAYYILTHPNNKETPEINNLLNNYIVKINNHIIKLCSKYNMVVPKLIAPKTPAYMVVNALP